MIPSILFGQTTPISFQDLTLLRTELESSQKSLQSLNKQLVILEQALTQANRNSESLETALAEAQRARKELEQKVETLKHQLIVLSLSLDESKQVIQDNEIAQVAQIEGLSKSYARKITIQRIIMGVLSGLVVAGGIYIVATK